MNGKIIINTPTYFRVYFYVVESILELLHDWDDWRELESNLSLAYR